MKQTATKSGRPGKVNKNGKRGQGPRVQQNGKDTTRKQGPEEKSTPTSKAPAKSGTGSNVSLLERFFLDQLKDIYYAEQKILQALPKMREAATTEVLQDAFEDHLMQTERHVRRLEMVFELLEQRPEGKVCEAIEGITREAETIIRETSEGTMTRDAALIIAAQKVEHYEIATYGGLVQLAITMELDRVALLLDRTLVEEEDTDLLLTDIAESEINLCAELEGNEYQEAASGAPAQNEKEEELPEE